MDAEICIQTNAKTEYFRRIPEHGMKKILSKITAGIYKELLERENFSLNDILAQIQLAFSNVGITDIVRLTKDNEDFYLDEINDPFDFKRVINDFKEQTKYLYTRHYDAVFIISEYAAEKVSYTLKIQILRVHHPKQYPIIFQIKAYSENLSEYEIELKFKYFIEKLFRELKKYINHKEIIFRLHNHSYNQKTGGYEKQMVDTDAEDFSSDYKTKIHYKNPLFPLHQVILGKTTIKELKKLGSHSKDLDSKRRPYKYYKINGMNFWYENNIATRIYITKYEAMPVKWQKIGFKWSLSYNNWLKLFKKLGCYVSIIEKPSVGLYNMLPSFNAEVMAVLKTKDIQYEIKLGFRYSNKVGKKTKNTLYNLRIAAV